MSRSKNTIFTDYSSSSNSSSSNSSSSGTVVATVLGNSNGRGRGKRDVGTATAAAATTTTAAASSSNSNSKCSDFAAAAAATTEVVSVQGIPVVLLAVALRTAPAAETAIRVRLEKCAHKQQNVAKRLRKTVFFQSLSSQAKHWFARDHL